MNKTSKKKYVTISEGTDFRTIAKIMTNNGFVMNHATARNVLISAIKRILLHSASEIGIRISAETLNELVKDQSLHSALADVLYRAQKMNNEEINGN